LRDTSAYIHGLAVLAGFWLRAR